MRGKGIRSQHLLCHQGITPAYAGKSLCGFFDLSAQLGSPPPMRGKAVSPIFDWTDDRITPAYAGKSRVHD